MMIITHVYYERLGEKIKKAAEKCMKSESGNRREKSNIKFLFLQNLGPCLLWYLLEKDTEQKQT